MRNATGAIATRVPERPVRAKYTPGSSRSATCARWAASLRAVVTTRAHATSAHTSTSASPCGHANVGRRVPSRSPVVGDCNRSRHVPATQTAPATHRRVHAPQRSRSLSTATHRPLHTTDPGASQAHAPATHALWAGHCAPHAPQFIVSRSRCTHTPSHVVAVWSRQRHSPATHSCDASQRASH